MQIKKQTGFTLVELLVAISLGVLLLGIVITIYLSSKATFSAATGVARSQETTRFATHFLKQDIRMSGFSECSEGVSKQTILDDSQETSPPSINNAIFGWEFTGTGVGETYDLNYETLGDSFDQADLTAARANNSGNANQWTGRFIRGIPGTPVTLNLPTTLAGFNPIAGSDIVMVSISTPLLILPERQPQQKIPRLNVTDFNENSVTSGVDTGTILKVGDCSSLDTFQNVAGPTDTFISADGAGVNPGNRLTGGFEWQKKWDESARIYETTTSVYYIGTGASGRPSLFRFETKCGISTDCGDTPQELVEGVESMQFLYGEDFNADGAADVYRSADDVLDFREVASVKVGMLVRSPDVGTDVQIFPNLDLIDEITINPPDDQFQRFVNNTTIRIHNRGL